MSQQLMLCMCLFVSMIRAIHSVVRPILGGFFAPHLQELFSLIPNRTSPMKGWELIYKRCSAKYWFGALSSVNSSFSQELNTMHLTTPNHIILIKKKNPNIPKKKFKRKQIHNLSLKHTPFQITIT